MEETLSMLKMNEGKPRFGSYEPSSVVIIRKRENGEGYDGEGFEYDGDDAMDDGMDDDEDGMDHVSKLSIFMASKSC
ncbi:hypothetical protein L1987_05835 [Smallanthus sonchifolius]|uniref:Uncharacterized protein n=1 Tax=Smallanthus sonchifolius TaxID=185202 RepID=A0ACB9JWK5_9ASTR|nr:hypothetical protein L1987_05835 [Smallanthus sonchifolius]